MANWIPVTVTGTTTHPDTPKGATAFSGDNFGAPVVFYMTGRPAKGTKKMLKMMGRPLAAEINANQFLSSPPTSFEPL